MIQLNRKKRVLIKIFKTRFFLCSLLSRSIINKTLFQGYNYDERENGLISLPLFLAPLHFLLLHITAHLSHKSRCVHWISCNHFNDTESYNTFLFSLDYSLVKFTISPDRNSKGVSSKSFS